MTVPSSLVVIVPSPSLSNRENASLNSVRGRGEEGVSQCCVLVIHKGWEGWGVEGRSDEERRLGRQSSMGAVMILQLLLLLLLLDTHPAYLRFVPQSVDQPFGWMVVRVGGGGDEGATELEKS